MKAKNIAYITILVMLSSLLAASVGVGADRVNFKGSGESFPFPLYGPWFKDDGFAAMTGHSSALSVTEPPPDCRATKLLRQQKKRNQHLPYDLWPGKSSSAYHHRLVLRPTIPI